MNLSKPVVAAIDFSLQSAQVLHQAARIAKIENVPLFVIHVVFPGLLPHRPGSRPEPVVVDNALLQAEEMLSQLVAKSDLEVPVNQLVLLGRPPDEIGKLIESEEAGLLVISAGSPGRKRLGSIASRCVRTVDCDVLLVREKETARYQRVLACIDLSEASDSVLERSIEAARHGASLEIVHVAFPVDKDPGMSGEVTEIATENRALVEKWLARLIERHAEDLRPIDYEVQILESAVPSVALICHAEDSQADLVVMGTAGHSKIGAMFFGTNAEKMFNDVEASVLAVRI